MIFTKQQTEEILKIMDYHYSFTIMMGLGSESLSTDDELLLNSFGINIDDYKGLFSDYDMMFYLGRLASVLSDKDLNTVKFDDFKQYFKRGQYVPLTKNEKFQLDIAKRKTYSHLKGLANKSKQYMSDLILDKEKTLRKEYERVIQGEIERGVVDRKSVQSIISEIGHKMEDWQRDWGRIVETEMNNIFQEGKAQNWLDEDGESTQVYKTVYPKACRHCIELYLTKGIGSKPRVFKLSDLIKNGDNLNKKVADWKAVVGSTHPFCRCDLQQLPKGYEWNDETGQFELSEKQVEGLSYKGKFTIQIGDKVLVGNK